MLQITTNITKQLCDSRYFATRAKQQILKSYETLGVAEDCDDETLRLAFVSLAKKFHPDSGSSTETNADKFSEIKSAYRKIQQSRSEEREKKETEIDIKHTAPQHRHYLSHDVGFGTPSARQKLHEKQRAQKALENVMEHRLQKLQETERNSLIGIDKTRAKDVKTRFGIDRLVEDLIQEAMNKGEFNNLQGMGKPLKTRASDENPYVDFVTHKLNKVMIDNGFAPEWIQLSKEIREDTRELKEKLNEDGKSWEKLKPKVDEINEKIDKFNLLVPILQKQMLRVDLHDLADNAMKTPPEKIVKAVSSDEDTFIATLISFFRK